MCDILIFYIDRWDDVSPSAAIAETKARDNSHSKYFNGKNFEINFFLIPTFAAVRFLLWNSPNFFAI